MMSSSQVIEALNTTARLMELHGENPFKTRAYSNAAFRLGKMRFSFEGKTRADIEAIEGIGKSLSEKIMEIASTGSTADLAKLLECTPPGIVQMLGIKGLGPRKVKQLWEELHCESVGELLYACNENRLTGLKGFGEKSQEQIRNSIEFRLGNAGRMHFSSGESCANGLLKTFSAAGITAATTGELARCNEVVGSIDILAAGKLDEVIPAGLPVPVQLHECPAGEFAYHLVRTSATDEHLRQIGFETLPRKDYRGEEELYAALGLQYIPPELREGRGEVDLARRGALPELITYAKLRGVLHNHSTYSDGAHSLAEMSAHCRQLGFSYLGICDHSRTAVYARGLSIESVAAQQAEIDALNASDPGFRVLKGIESDILGDGSLDYPPEILKTFDFVVASVHSNLKMTEEKATARLIRAIENPFTRILGHPSGRLLLARPGYPLDYRKIIDACAANKVSIELNAHPYRLDIDWRWIPYCMEKGVLISVNPDAHHKESMADMRYGVLAARKGMLTAAACLNAMELPELLAFFRK